MTIIKNPDFTASCEKCKAVLLFTVDDVFDATNGCCKYKAIKCPCCNSFIRIWG